jgi:predicted Zn-dependent protease
LRAWVTTGRATQTVWVRNSNSLANQLGIHLILPKHEKLTSNSSANQLGKNRNLTKLASQCAYTPVRIVVATVFPCRWEGEKGNKE